MSRLVLVPSGTVVDLDRVMFSIKDSKMIGKFPFIIAGGGDLAPVLEGADIDALINAGLVKELKAPSLIASNDGSHS